MDKFAKSGVKVGLAKSVKAPILKDAVAALECKIVKMVETGDHILVMGEVVDAAKLRDEDPIMFLYGRTVKVER
ncbi:MAG: hypothetical protein DRK00_05025 [Thermoprotei archaeon]|nr:MAG: hypothetical protein DRK00_05025 [Thermoprotei archaeon]